jgi:hypothetical protein
MIGSLLWLIRSAAIQAVIDGTEHITRKTMDTIQVCIASQSTGSRAARSHDQPWNRSAPTSGGWLSPTTCSPATCAATSPARRPSRSVTRAAGKPGLFRFAA